VRRGFAQKVADLVVFSACSAYLRGLCVENGPLTAEHAEIRRGSPRRLPVKIYFLCKGVRRRLCLAEKDFPHSCGCAARSAKTRVFDYDSLTETISGLESVMQPSSAGSSDPLAVIISLLRPQTVVSKMISGAGKWSIRKPRYEDPAFCLLLDGACFLDLDGVGALELREGDFVLLPATPSFTLASDLSIKPTLSAFDYSRETHHGSESSPVTMRMLGGYFRFDRANAQLLVRLLPPVVHVRRDEPGATRLHRIVELIDEEADAQLPGADLILERLVEVLLFEALRFRAASAAREEQGLLAGLSDPALARTLREIHVDVARRWTVEQLARTAGMSRAVFAERFSRKIGMPPMQYLLEWRVALAKDMLRRERPPLAEVAERVGYQSASAFSTAFTRLTGRAPSDFARSEDATV
jgi:AraC-like DNA-binding protein